MAYAIRLTNGFNGKEIDNWNAKGEAPPSGGGPQEIRTIDGVEKPYLGYSPEMSNAMNGQLIVISSLCDYKKWEMDKIRKRKDN